MNETAAESGRFPNRNRMWSVRNEQVKRVRGTSMETKEKAARMRRKQKRLVQVIRSQLIPSIWLGFRHVYQDYDAEPQIEVAHGAFTDDGMNQLRGDGVIEFDEFGILYIDSHQLQNYDCPPLL